MKDEESAVCLACSGAFSFIRRRHHCRCCGKLFCSNCLKRHNLPQFGYKEPQSTCDSCIALMKKNPPTDLAAKNTQATKTMQNQGKEKESKKVRVVQFSVPKYSYLFEKETLEQSGYIYNCVICKTKPEAHSTAPFYDRFKCSHNVVCLTCSKYLSYCPICRKSLRTSQV